MLSCLYYGISWLHYVFAVKWVPIFHLVGNFQLLVLLVLPGSIKMVGLQHPQLDTQSQHTKSYMSFGYILLRRQRKVHSLYTLVDNLFQLYLVGGYLIHMMFIQTIQLRFGACFTSNQSCSLFDINPGQSLLIDNLKICILVSFSATQAIATECLAKKKVITMEYPLDPPNPTPTNR